MTLLSPPAYRTDALAITRDRNGVMATEASQFRPGFVLGRVYDDACDEGLTLVSHKTGREVVFAMYLTHRDRDGDVTRWDLRAVTPGQRGLRLTVFND